MRGVLIALVSCVNLATGIAFDVAATDVLALASLVHFCGLCDVSATATQVLAAVVVRTASIALPANEVFLVNTFVAENCNWQLLRVRIIMMKDCNGFFRHFIDYDLTISL